LRKAIIEVAGNEVQTAYDAEYKNNPDNILISTSPGNLPCKRIFFVKWPPATDEAKLRELIFDVMWTVIHNVLENNFTSLAFPVIVCGKRSCSADILVKTIINEMKLQLTTNDLPFTVKFIIQATQQDFCGEFCKEVLTTQDGIVLNSFLAFRFYFSIYTDKQKR
jgi:hypothetical protein